MNFDPDHILKTYGEAPDAKIDLFEAALALAAPDHPGISVQKYTSHREKLTRETAARHAAYLEKGAVDDAGTCLAALKHVIADVEGYVGDEQNYDDLQNADLMRVIDRRKGLPIALGILYLSVGRALGWAVDGLNFPGHFLCRIEAAGQRLIFDPFSRCAVLEAPALRQLLKKFRGNSAELSADYYTPCANREILIRLQNNIKLRLIEAGEYAQALLHVERMRMISPQEYRLLLDAGVLYAKTGAKPAAIDVLEKYIAACPHSADRRDAEAILWQLRAERPG